MVLTRLPLAAALFYSAVAAGKRDTTTADAVVEDPEGALSRRSSGGAGTAALCDMFTSLPAEAVAAQEWPSAAACASAALDPDYVPSAGARAKLPSGSFGVAASDAQSGRDDDGLALQLNRVQEYQTRQLQQQSGGMCSGNSDPSLDVSCLGGASLVTDAASTTGSDPATCCICPAGTTATYADEALAFRFQADGIMQDSDGSLVWNAATPSGLAFVTARTIVNGSSEPMEQSGHGWFDFPSAAPAVIDGDAQGLPAGLMFSLVPEHAEVMYANQTVAIGAQHTFFAVFTPTAVNPLWVETILGFRPGGLETGLFEWFVGSHAAASPSERAFSADTWSSCGFAGPPIQPGVTQVLIARSVHGVDAAGVSGPVVSMAVLNMLSPTPNIVWASTMYGTGLRQYAFDQQESFDLDFRDPDVDRQHVVAAGYMILG
jgi:hypothetical protein